MHSTPQTIDSRPAPISRETVAGVLALIAAVAISFVAVLLSESIAYGQVQSPVIGGSLWPASVGFAIIFVIVATLFVLIVALGIINAIGTPRLRSRTEYTLLGLGGLVGTAAAAIVSFTYYLTSLNAISGHVPAGAGQSLAVLGVVSVPFAYVYYELYRPDMTPIPPGHQDDEQLDPEYVRKATTRWSNKEAATPARQQCRHNSQHDQSNDSPFSEHVTNDDSSDDSSLHDQSLDLTEMEYRWVTETDVSFDDVGGMEDLKSDLRRDVIKPLTTHREKAEELGVSAPNIIFHGPPGTGKTYVAQALATELGLPFSKLSGADVQSKWINESAQKVKTLFEESKQVAEQEGGAVVFLDELDSVLKDRSGGSNSHEEDTKVVNEFLNPLEDTEDHNVVFIGATNRLESLDEAGIRSGRIDKKIHVGKPNAGARAAILDAHLADRPHELTGQEIRRAAELTSGLVAADLELVVETAAKRVLERDGNAIRWGDLQHVINSHDSLTGIA